LLDRQEEREGGIRLVAVVGRVGYLPGRYQQSRTQDGRLATPERPKAVAARTYQAPSGAIPSVAQGISLGKGEKIHRNPASWRGGRLADAMRDDALWLFYLSHCNNWTKNHEQKEGRRIC